VSSLYERLGGTEGITKIADVLIDIHAANPVIAPRYTDSDLAAVKHAAATFFIQGTGGPEVYEGKDMLAAHRGMNIDAEEFIAVLDDVVVALNRCGVGQREKEEALFVFFGLKNEIIRV
jgi:hemoglobin